jgi:recombination protein RecR
MDKYPESFERLIEVLKSFPGVGRRSAERMAFAMLKWTPEKTSEAGRTISGLHGNVSSCADCGNLCEKDNLCAICSDTHRDRSVLCIVEDVPQIHSIEKCRTYRGLYHVLHGKIIPLDGKNIGGETLDKLRLRIESGEVKELVMALSMDVEGQATAIYLSDLFKNSGVRITRIARGLPAGSDISFADPATISAAMSGRTQM